MASIWEVRRTTCASLEGEGTLGWVPFVVAILIVVASGVLGDGELVSC